MKPHRVTFYVYAETQDEVLELQRQMYEFVNGQYKEGRLVTAPKLTEALKKFKNNMFVKNYFHGT